MKLYKTLANGVKIIEYEECYAAGLADMWNRSRDSWGGGDDIETEQSIIDFNRNGSYYNIYLAIDADEVVGLCSLQRYYKDADALYIHVLNVRPDYMSQKVGKALVLQCVERTIELGFPRLEIHTWAGNTKAVPVYKKCGYMWEDNSETTHLTNYIPTILSQEALKPFFEKADWYEDSTRQVEIKPDGVKQNGFEYFTYTWANDSKSLAVTFEKHGRRISRVETEDYVVELVAENHELAHGFTYKAEVLTENKSGKPLDVEVSGKRDGAISFSCEENSVTVSKPDTKQDEYRKHPCVLADVTINGRKVEMGVGINAKEPLTGYISTERSIAFEGQSFVAYFTIESSLTEKVAVRLTLPQSEYVRFDKATHDFEVGAHGRFCLSCSSEALKMGCLSFDAICTITMKDGQTSEFSVPLSIINQSLTSRFSFETEDYYGIANGPFRIETGKKDNMTAVRHLLITDPGVDRLPIFEVSKLGKPYDDEFDLAKPNQVYSYESGADMVMELTYESAKQIGVQLTMIFSLNATGVVTRSHRICNTSSNERSLFLNETGYTSVFHNASYRYNGRNTLAREGDDEGFNVTDSWLFEENWVFENDAQYSVGVCWDPLLKPSFKHDTGVVLEHGLKLLPGNTVETPPVCYYIGIFKDYSAFRNFARRMYNPYKEYAEDIIELSVNNGNPFINDNKFQVDIRNNRSKAYKGSIEVSPAISNEFFEKQTCEFPDDNSSVSFEIKPFEKKKGEPNKWSKETNKESIDNIGIIRVRTGFPTHLNEKTRAVFFSSGNVELRKNETALEASNGCLTYKLDPSFYPGLFSLSDNAGTEWLLSKYPKLEPFSWWNPFTGGTYNWHEKMNASNTLKESISAKFAKLTDGFGNIWEGIMARVDVRENKEYKGLCYETFYLTLPGAPILCSFTRYKNNTGGYLSTNISENVLFMTEDQNGKRTAEVMHRGNVRRFHLGTAAFETNISEFVRLRSVTGASLHWMPNLSDRHTQCAVGDDINFFACERNNFLRVKNGETVQTKPIFYVLGAKDLTPDELIALMRLDFPKGSD